MDKILLIKTSSLGDIVHIYPVVDFLRKKFPAAQIDWVVEAPFADIVKSHPAINRVITPSTKSWRKSLFNNATINSIRHFRNELRREHYDAIFDLQGNIKSGLILSQARSTCKIGFGKKTVPEWPNLLFTNHRINPSKKNNIRQDYLSIVATYFNELPVGTSLLGTKNVCLKITPEEETLIYNIGKAHTDLNVPTVMVCPGSAWRNKQLTNETLKGFLLLLRDYLKCHFLFIWGTDEEKKSVDQLHLDFVSGSLVVDKMNLPMLQNLMARSALVIAVDSLPLHLAGTTSTPTFSVFGASSAMKYKPPGESHFALQGECPYGRTFEKRCPVLRTCPTGACIRSMGAQEVFKAFKFWWEGR